MSNWTHVAAIFRVDSIRRDVESLKEKFGKEVDWYSPDRLWQELEDHPERFLPSGSEGTLQMSIWENPNKNCMTAYTVSVFGDLRDHDDPDEIIEWFRKKCSELFLRQAVIHVDNERNGSRTESYER